MKKLAFIVSALVLLGGCSTPASYTSAPMRHFDNNTDYAIENLPTGFSVSINYSRYQFIESSDIVPACRSALKTVAWDTAGKRGRKIEPLDEQAMRISIGRNEFSGITTCSANAIAQWAH